MATNNAAEDTTLQHRELSTPDPLLARGMRVTWWYTFGGIVIFELVYLFLAASLLVTDTQAATGMLVLLCGGTLWIAATTTLLSNYRRCVTTGDDPVRWRIWVALSIAILFSIALILVWNLWSLALMPLVQTVMLLQWPPGIRNRVATAMTAALVVLVFVDGMAFTEHPVYQGNEGAWWFTALYFCLIPVMTVFSLWWWDVVVRLDHARAAEGRLAATQERLRVATDVHDLQGHHLQVIALQLELAERLMQHDPVAALEQLGEARRSVDTARQGTRDLAKPFQGVPLPDEIENAADLLRAAGARVETLTAVGASGAPAEVLGPVIRETTTNVLKHGGGVWVQLSLEREGHHWRYRIANDLDRVAAENDPECGQGSGLDGMRRRLSEVGGELHVTRTDETFTVTAVIPAGQSPAAHTVTGVPA